MTSDMAKALAESVSKFEVASEGDSFDAEHDAACEMRDLVTELLNSEITPYGDSAAMIHGRS